MNPQSYIEILAQISSRYFVLAGLAFLLFYFLWKERKQFAKIQRRFPKNKDYLREIGYSLITMCIFAGIPWLFFFHPSIRETTLLLSTPFELGKIWFFLAFPLMVLIHDTYFYWTHRLMHHPALFSWFHLVHHKSTNPSPWAAYAFHPLEAVVEVGIFVLFVYLLPLHPLHIILFFLFSIIYNIYGHLGFELYPAGFQRHWLGKWINTSISHNQHHQFFTGNYGLYFLWWDRWMGTIRKDYDKQFDEVKSRRASLDHP
jgi:sterol desaturase/sphingolipid hydroxylase (fatty acid hydroxylase superfamily)